MRRVLILLSVAAVAVACAKKEEAPPAADTTAAAMAPAPAPAAPAALTEADVAGTWKGTSSTASDSVIAHWTQVCAAGKCTGTSTENKTTIHSTYTFAGDSAIGVSEPFANPEMKGLKVIDTWVVHQTSPGNVTGTGAFKLASKPDSVVVAYKFTGTKQK